MGIITGKAFLNNITASELKLDEVISNEILFDDEVCTGEVVVNVQKDLKAKVLRTVLEKYEINSGNIISFGDGLADTQMFNLSTLSVAIFPSTEEVTRSADFTIDSEPIDQVIEQLVELKL